MNYMLKITFLMSNINRILKRKELFHAGVVDKHLEIRFSTTVFWAILSKRHAILARKRMTTYIYRMIHSLHAG